MTYQIKALANAIPVRPYEDDNEVIKQLSDAELRPVSVIIRTLIHEAICARLGVTDQVRIPMRKLSEFDQCHAQERQQADDNG